MAPHCITHNFKIFKNIPHTVNIKFIFSKYNAVFELKQHKADSNAIKFLYFFIILNNLLIFKNIFFNKKI